ncbi:MAG: hypothetical protein IKV52_04540 [Oscillospiraceae bacterium]|nr:hypothetical protein [Oscillospiraceae bacterium]
MKKLLSVLLILAICISVFAGCSFPADSTDSGHTDAQEGISGEGTDSEITTPDPSLLLDANVLSKMLPPCLDTNTTPEDPQFSFTWFMLKCAVEKEKEFCYYNIFPNTGEPDYFDSFKYADVQKVFGQVFNAKAFADELFAPGRFEGWSHRIEGDTLYLATETGSVWFYHAGDYIYSEFANNNRQVVSHIELFAPDASSGDPGHRSIGGYKIYYNVLTEDGETFLRFDRFEKDENVIVYEEKEGYISFDNSCVIDDITAVYNNEPFEGVEELDFLRYSNLNYSFRVWRVFDETDTDQYWIACRFVNDRLVGFLKISLSGLGEFYENRIAQDFEFFTNHELSIVKIRSKNHPSVFSFEFYNNSFTIQDYSSGAMDMEPQQYLDYIVDANKLYMQIATGAVDGERYNEYSKLIKDGVNDGIIELNCDYGIGKTYRDYYNVNILNYQDHTDYLVIDYYITCAETALGMVQSTLFEKQDGNLVYSQTSPVSVYGDFVAQSKDERYKIYRGAGFKRGTYTELFVFDSYKNRGHNMGLVTDTGTGFDVGFMSNGDLYVMNNISFTTYTIDDGIVQQNFSTKDNFPAGGVIAADGTKRFLFAVRRDPVNMDYILIYGEYIEDADYSKAHPNDFQMAYNYKVGLLDKNGNLTQSWDTGVPIMYSSFGFEDVSMYKVNENEIEFYVTYKTEERLRGRFDITTGVYTPIKEFKLP